MTTNLYQFLKDIRDQAQGPYGDVVINEDQWNWLNDYLREPDTEVHFSARATGEIRDGQPVMAQHYAIAGEEMDVFSLLAEAALQNPTFARLVHGVSAYLRDHVPQCPACRAAQVGLRPMWQFKLIAHSPNQKDGTL